MRTSNLILLLTVFAACLRVDTSVSLHRLGNQVIVDSGAFPVKFLSYEEKSSYPIYYVGPEQDTIDIHQACEAIQPDWSVPSELPYSRTYSDRTLELFVDTTLRTCATVRYLSTDPSVARDSSIHYSSFLFRMRNTSDSAILLGWSYYLYFLHREAKAKNGAWVKIDSKLSEIGLCLTNEPCLLLKKREMLFAKVKRYQGTYVTDFRLVFGNGDDIVYSNTWRDSIDERTLELATDR